MKSQSQQWNFRKTLSFEDLFGQERPIPPPTSRQLLCGLAKFRWQGHSPARLHGLWSKQPIHSAQIIQLSTRLPLVVEIVNTEDKINGFLPLLDDMMSGGLVSLEKVRVVRYKAVHGSD
jgi:Uncharacterized ACR, COG1993